MTSRKSIFSWYRLAKMANIPYHFFTQNKLEGEQKERIKTVIEQGTNKLLGGNHKIIETFSIELDKVPDTDSPDKPDNYII